MLYNSFTGTEWSRNCSSTAFCNWEQGINNTLTGNHRDVWRKLFSIWTLYTNRPSLKHADIVDVAVFIFYFCDGFGDVVAAGGNLNDLTFNIFWNHDLVGNDGCFLYGTKYIAHYNMVANFSSCNKIPFLFMVQRSNIDTSGDVASGHFSDLGQRTLDTVKDTGQYTWSQLNRHRETGGFYQVARTDTGSFLINLNGCLVISHFDDFADELLLTNTNYVTHIGVTHVFCNDQRTGNLNNFALAQYFHLL